MGLLSAGCDSGKVPVDTADLSGADRAACASLVDALPDTVSDELRRPVDPQDAYAAAWGDPAIVLRCGVSMPAAFDEFATCHEANGVGWFIPDAQAEDQDAEIVMTTIGRAQNVEVRLPARYRPPATAMVDLSAAITEHITEIDPCV